MLGNGCGKTKPGSLLLNSLGVGMMGEGIVPEEAVRLEEISSYGEGFLEFFNQTIVMGTLYL